MKAFNPPFIQSELCEYSVTKGVLVGVSNISLKLDPAFLVKDHK